MTDRERYECSGCDRTFLSQVALERHYDRNPTHAERFVLDADAIDGDGTKLAGGKWVETDETVETFVTATDDSPAPIEMTYDPDAGSLVIHGIRDREIDLTGFWESVGNTLTWSFDGTYHKIQFQKETNE